MPSTSSAASCSPGTRSDSCQPCAKAGPALQLGLSALRGKGWKLSKCRVYSWKGHSPSLPRPTPRCRGPAHSLHCHPPGSLPAGPGDLLMPRHCASTHPCMAQSPVPRSRFSLCHPHLPRAAVDKGRDGWCSRCQVQVLVPTPPQTAVGHVPPSAAQPCQP